MSKWTRTAGVILMAAASVYAGQGFLGTRANAASPKAAGSAASNDVKLLDESPADPFAEPTTQPAEFEPADTGGTSVNSTDVSVNDMGTVEIHVNDANLVEVLRMLSLQSQRNIIASREVGGKVTANLYGVTVREALDAILKANGYAYREQGNFIHVYSAKEIAEIEKAERVTTTEVFRLFYTPASNAMTMVKPVLSSEAQVSFNAAPGSGIPSGTSDTGGSSHATEDMLVITDYPDNLERVRKLLQEVDRRPQQVMIEATILRASLNEDNALGVDFNILSGVDFTGISSSNGQIIGAPTGPGDPVNTIANSVGTGNSFTSPIPGGLKVGFVSQNVSVFLAALEGVTDTTILANPKVLALNKQKGEIIVGRKDGYKTTTVTESTAVETVEFLDTGTRLVFRPFIAEDGYIRMEIHPEDSSGGLGTANLPFKITTEVTSNIMVKDGHTVVIGGLFRESSDTTRSQIPFFGNLPLAGHLFRNQRDRSSREEVIILLTPHIIKDDVAFNDASLEQLRNGEKLRVGVRKGMMPWGRERLAEGCYEKALEEYRKGKNKSAVFWLNCATNSNPKFLEAINLKQDITGREVTTVDNSSVRGFVKAQVMEERVRGTRPTTRPASVAIASPKKQSAESLRTASAPTTQPGDSAFAGEPNSGVEVKMLPVDEPSTQPSTQPSTRPTFVGEPLSRSSDENSGSGEWNGTVGFFKRFVPQDPAQDQTNRGPSVTELPRDDE